MRIVATTIALIAMATMAAPAANAQWWSPSYSRSTTATSPARSAASTIFSGSAGYPVGTQTSESPRVIGAPGESMYFNNAGLGYYRTNPTASHYPAFSQPINGTGTYPQLGGLTERTGYWRATSGYYYPWYPPVYLPGATYSAAPSIYLLQQGLLTATQPTINTMLSDMRQFVESAKEKHQLDQSNYENFFRRVNDLTAKYSDLSARSGGTLNISDDAAMRKEIDLLGADLARSLNP